MSGWSVWTSRIIHAQNGIGLVCGLSTRKILHPLLDPEEHDALELLPQRLAVAAVEVQRVDVLVLLGRVLRVLDRAVRPVVEPLGVLAHVRVVGRALERVVQRDLDPVLPGARARAPGNRRGCPSAGSTALCPPCSLPMAHGEPGSSGAAVRRVVAALAEAPPDGMDRREVDDVEAHRGDGGQPVDAVLEGAVPAGDAPLRAREHLVPRRRTRRAAGPRPPRAPGRRRWRRCDRDSAPRARARRRRAASARAERASPPARSGRGCPRRASGRRPPRGP